MPFVRVWGLVLLIAVSGCRVSGVKTCETHADCGAEAECLPAKVCALKAVAVVVPSCDSVQCPGAMECKTGTCTPRYASLEWVSPQDGARIDAGAVPFLIALRAVDAGTRADPDALFVAITGVGSTRSGLFAPRIDAGLYAGTVSVSGSGDEGEWQLATSFADAGFSIVTRRFTVDRTAPAFVVDLASPPMRPTAPLLSWDDPQAPGNPWRRDELTHVRLSASADDVLGASVEVLLVHQGDAGEVTTALVEGTCPSAHPCVGFDAGFCRCYDVDFAAIAFNAFRGAMTVRASGSDVAGNGSSSSSSPQSVTRWRWSRSVVDAGVGDIFTGMDAPVVGRDGTLYVRFGTTAGMSSGSLAALWPDGTQRWVRALGRASSGVGLGVRADGGDIIFVGAGYDSTVQGPTDPIPAALALLPNGAVVNSCTLASGTAFETSGAPVVFPGAVPKATFVVTGLGRYLTLDDGQGCAWEADGGLAPGDPIAYPPRQVGAGSHTVTQQMPGQLMTAYSPQGASPLLGWPWTGANANTGEGLSMYHVSGVPHLLITGLQSTASVPFVSPTPTGSFSWNVGNGNLGSITLSGDGSSFFVATTLPPKLVRFNGTGQTVAQGDIGADKASALALGEGGKVYSVNGSGTLTVWTRDVAPLWSTGLGVGSLGDSPKVTLDCNRIRSGAVGSLYLASRKTQSVVAVVVDSKGLDLDAHWPLDRHDSRHTSYLQTPLDAFGCRK